MILESLLKAQIEPEILILTSFIVLVVSYMTTAIITASTIVFIRFIYYGPFKGEFNMKNNKKYYCNKCGYEISSSKYYENKGLCDSCLAQKLAEEMRNKK